MERLDEAPHFAEVGHDEPGAESDLLQVVVDGRPDVRFSMRA